MKARAIDLGPAGKALRSALDAHDVPRTRSILDGMLGWFGIDSVATELVLPLLRDMARRRRSDPDARAREELARAVLTDHLLQLARGWGEGSGPRAILACAPGQRNEVALILFGLTLRSRGWRVTHLGPSTPMWTLGAAVGALTPRLVVVSATRAEQVWRVAPVLAEIARESIVAFSGPPRRLADAVAIPCLRDDLVQEAERISDTCLAPHP